MIRKDGKPQYRRNTMQEKIWTTMKVLRIFTVEDLQANLGMTGVIAKRGTVLEYIQKLVMIEYVKVLEKDNAYQLIKFTGSKSPVATGHRLKKEAMFDHNINKLVQYTKQTTRALKRKNDAKITAKTIDFIKSVDSFTSLQLSKHLGIEMRKARGLISWLSNRKKLVERVGTEWITNNSGWKSKKKIIATYKYIGEIDEK